MEYIAEIGSNWYNGDPKSHWSNLKSLIKSLKNKAEYIKFQAWDTPKFVHMEHPDYDVYEKYELPKTWYSRIVKECGDKFMVTAFDEETSDEFHKLGCTNWKIASGDLPHLKLIGHIARYNQPMFLSTGNGNEYEISRAVNYIRKYNTAPLTILHCISKYPTLLSECGFGMLKKLVYKYGLNCKIGWSNHVSYPDAAIATATAKALGATVIETHVRSTGAESPDASFAMTEDEFGLFKREIELIDMEDPIIDEHELLWARRGDDGLRPWIDWEVRDGK